MTSSQSGNPEVDKAVNQLEAQRPPVEDAAEVVDNAVGKYADPDEFFEGSHDPADLLPEANPEAEGVPYSPEANGDVTGQVEEPKKAPAKKTAKKAAKKTSSGNRAAKQNSEEE